MKPPLIAALLLLALATAAHGFGLGLGTRLGRLGAISKSGSVTPASCSGVIDASAGCPLPMLGS
jgi:hypothetical protein